MDMVKRPRRLRGGETLRRMVRETRMDKASLVYPMFVVEGKGIRHEIPSMPGQYHYSLDMLPAALEEAADAGVSSIMLFGIPDKKVYDISFDFKDFNTSPCDPFHIYSTQPHDATGNGR